MKLLHRLYAWAMEPVDVRDVGCWPLMVIVAAFWGSLIIAWAS